MIKSVAIIPCYNEEKTIGGIIQSLFTYVDKVIVVDNKSLDQTAKVASDAGAWVCECHQKGMGIALKTGLDFVHFLNLQPEIYVMLDGDGQHVPSDVPKLIDSIENGADVAIGVRADDDSMPAYRRFGNAVIRDLTNIGGCRKVVDAQCGFRAMNQRAVRTLDIVESGFGCITETIIKARKAGLKIAEVPVKCIYHPNIRDNSTLNPIKHGIIVALKTVRWRIWEHTGI